MGIVGLRATFALGLRAGWAYGKGFFFLNDKQKNMVVAWVFWDSGWAGRAVKQQRTLNSHSYPQLKPQYWSQIITAKP